MPQPYVGAVVIYCPDRKLSTWHDRGHGVVLPAIVTKVWDEVVNLRVADKPVTDSKVDLRVFLDSSNNPAFGFGSKYSEGGELDTWCWQKEVIRA